MVDTMLYVNGKWVDVEDLPRGVFVNAQTGDVILVKKSSDSLCHSEPGGPETCQRCVVAPCAYSTLESKREGK